MSRDTQVSVSEDVLFWAFRYALGRSTYAVNEVCEAVTAAAPKLAKTMRHKMAGEIDLADHFDKIGMKMDRAEWLRLRDVLMDEKLDIVDDVKTSFAPAESLPGAGWNQLLMPMVEDAVGETLVIGQILRFYDGGPTYAHACSKRLGAFENADGARAAVERAVRSEMLKLTPLKELDGSKPVVLYFGSDADRDEFIAMVQEAKPGMRAEKV